MLLHASRWREVQRDTAMLLCELGNCLLCTGTQLLVRREENTASFFRFLKKIAGRNKIQSELKMETYFKKLRLNWIPRVCNEPHGPGSSFKSEYCPTRIPTTPTVGASSLQVKLRISSVLCVQYTRAVKVRELIAVKVLHNSLLNTTVVAFKVLPLGIYALMSAPTPHFKTILELHLWNGLQNCHCITPYTRIINVIKMSSFQYFLYLREQKKVTGV